MKIPDRLISVLIIVIMSSVVAQEQIISQKESFENISDLGNITDSSIRSSITDIDEVPVFLEFEQYFESQMRRKCEKNRGLTAYNDSNYKDIALKFVNCVDSLVNITQFKSDMAAARPHHQQNVVIQNYCRRVPTFKNCLKNVTDSIKPCLDLEERESVNMLYNITISLLRFSCDNWDVVENFIISGGTECLSSNYPAIQECSGQIFPFPDPEPLTIPGLGDLPKLSLDITGRMNVEEYQRCSVKVLKQCDNSIPSVVVDDLFNFVKRETFYATLLDPFVLNSDTKRSTLSETILVKNRVRRTSKFVSGISKGLYRKYTHYPKRSRSQASPASVVNVLAIIVSMMTSLRFV